MIDAVARFVVEFTAPIIKRIDALEQRPTVKHCGVYSAGNEYAEASLVTYSGGMWIAERATSAKPGDDGSGWRLVVKSGHAVNGRDEQGRRHPTQGRASPGAATIHRRT